MIQIPRIIAIFLLCLLFPAPTVATTILPISLERLSNKAALIFYGIATSNKVEIDGISGRVATFTTFEIIEVVKGAAGDTHTIKQIGGQLPDSEIVHKIQGIPQFIVGNKYVVFLPEASRLGFASPLGLNQGRFVVREINGTEAVSNRRTSQGLLNNTPTAADNTLSKQRTNTSLTEFLQTVRELTAR